MIGRQLLRRFERFNALALAFYALFLVTAQFEHHDLSCELKTPLHCVSCAASQVGSDPQTPAGLERCHLVESACVVDIHDRLEGVLFTTLTSGRSPPSFA